MLAPPFDDTPPEIAPFYEALQRSAAAVAASNDASFTASASAFGTLDVDVLLLIAQFLAPHPGATGWIEKAKAAAVDLNALVRSCHFWRHVLCGAGHSLRLEAFALALGCIPSPLLPHGGAAGRCFAQMLVQERHLVHLRVLECAVELMLTHCTLAHCTDALRAMRTYRSSPFIVDTESASMATPKHALGRRALQGKRVELHVAATSATFKMGIVASQSARGATPGGVLLASAGLQQHGPPVFTYVKSEKARLYTPASELQKGPLFSPPKEVVAATVCGNVAILCLAHAEDDHPYEFTSHVISLWSLSGHNERPLSESTTHTGVALEVWAVEGESSDRGDYLEIFTLVSTMRPCEHGGFRKHLAVRSDRYATGAGVWSSVIMSDKYHFLASYNAYGTEWRYWNPPNHPKGVAVFRRALIATASPLASMALCVRGWIQRIPQLPEDSDAKHVPALVYRIVVVNKHTPTKTPTRFESIENQRVDVIQSYTAPYEGLDLLSNTTVSIENRVPHIHLSPCGTILVTTSTRGSTAPDMLSIYRRDPKLGWQRRARHERGNSYSTISGTPLKPSDRLWRHQLGDWPRQSNQKAHLIEWAYRCQVGGESRVSASAFSPCGKYLAMLTRQYIFIIDLHGSLCHEKLHVRGIRVSDQTRPVALAWPDGLFLETRHGVWHIGTYDNA